MQEFVISMSVEVSMAARNWISNEHGLINSDTLVIFAGSPT